MLFRIAYAALYAVLILSLSGVTTTAQALVSCQDAISTGTTYRYVDALSFFTELNGKTYAIAKSAVSGNQSLPDNYFAFSANISREYLMVGTDTASLKRMLSLGISMPGRSSVLSGSAPLTALLSLSRTGRQAAHMPGKIPSRLSWGATASGPAVSMAHGHPRSWSSTASSTVPCRTSIPAQSHHLRRLRHHRRPIRTRSATSCAVRT